MTDNGNRLIELCSDRKPLMAKKLVINSNVSLSGAYFAFTALEVLATVSFVTGGTGQSKVVDKSNPLI